METNLDLKETPITLTAYRNGIEQKVIKQQVLPVGQSLYDYAKKMYRTIKIDKTVRTCEMTEIMRDISYKIDWSDEDAETFSLRLKVQESK